MPETGARPRSGDSQRVAHAVARLRSAGERVTPARYAVLRVLDAADVSDEHLTAEQIGPGNEVGCIKTPLSRANSMIGSPGKSRAL